jgi:hypothetical protein
MSAAPPAVVTEQLVLNVYTIALESYSALKTGVQAESIEKYMKPLRTLAVTADNVTAANEFISQNPVRTIIRTNLVTAFRGIFADGAVSLSDIPIVIDTVRSITTALNALPHDPKRVAVAIAQESIIPIIECILIIVCQMMLPGGADDIVKIIRSTSGVLATQIVPFADKQGWLKMCC